MSKRILGLDLGTNSIGWAVVEKDDGAFQLVDKGVRIFQEGVKTEKGIESSKAANRTENRSARRIKYRRKLRKIETLKVLSEYGYCPQLAKEELDLWRYKRIYPQNTNFRDWWLTDEDTEKHPYFFRNLAVTQQLDLNNEVDRHKIGRAFYHMAQRRGFLSNRLDTTPENENGKVKSSIKELQGKKGDRTLGQYFYEDCYLKGEKNRNQYTHREEDYLDEFLRICNFQNIPNEIQENLKKAIFYQRPLKSQKGLVGKCVFETNKPRCAISRPEFEEYRMLCFVNNMKIKTPYDEKLRPLNDDERSKVIPRFFLQREHFNFEDLAKQIAPKNQYKYYRAREKNLEDWLFNYSMKTTVSGCPLSARFKELFGGDFIDDKFSHAKDEQNKTPKKVSDAWHALYTFDSDAKLKVYAQKHLNLDDKKTILFSEKIRLKQDFASLSLKAINKVLPYLRSGLIYSHAVFLANMEEALPPHIWQNAENRKIIRNEVKKIIENQNDDKTIVNIVNGFITNARKPENNYSWSEEAKSSLFTELSEKIISAFGKKRFETFSKDKKSHLKNNSESLLEENMQKNFGKGEHIKVQRIDEAVACFLEDNFGEINSEKIYHPSAVETYKPAKRTDNGSLFLGSPMTSSVRNPMAMRALHQLRLVANELIKEGIIDTDTKINIEMARGLLNANERAGLKRWQDNREKKRKEYVAKIKEFFSEDYQPSEDELLKYQLWEEQKHKCLYTGHEISLNTFLGPNPLYDIEHTIPRSLSYDNSQENKTLCESKFNRDVKKNTIPYSLKNHAEILDRIEHWKKDIEKLDDEIERAVKQSASAADKDQKDTAIQKRHKLTNERNYWRNKYSRFTMKEVPDGFKNSQMVDIGIITKYSRLYLKTVFDKVYTVKGNTVADFRKMWGLQKKYVKKARINHVHHCIDAITIACMDKSNYETLAKFYRDSEDAFFLRNETKPQVKKPWNNFTEDVLNIENEILVSHYTPDNLPKQSKKKIRIRGKIQYKADFKKDIDGNVLKDKRGRKIVDKYHFKTIIDKDGEKKQVKIPLYEQGDTVRGSLHKDTFYGAIERELLNKKGELEKQVKYVVRKSLDSLEDSNLKNIVDERIKEIVTNARKEEKVFQKQIDALVKKRQKAEEWEEKEIDDKVETLKLQIQILYTLPNKNGNPIPIKKVRLYQPTVTNPLHIKAQRDTSIKTKKAYKEHYHVANDGNYIMAIYEGKDKKGKTIRDFELVNNINAGEYFKLSVKKYLEGQELNKFEGLIPKIKITKKNEISLKAILKTGTIVIVYKNQKEEVFEENFDAVRRIYKIIKMSKDGRVTLKYHQTAANDDKLKQIFEQDHNRKPAKSLTNGESKINFEIPHPKLLLSPSSFNFLVEGIDFKISSLGKITKISR